MVCVMVLDDEVAAMSSKLITRDDIDSMSRDEYDRRQNEQYAVFELLYPRVGLLLKRFGRPDFLRGQPEGDFSVHGDYSEYPQVVVFIHNLGLLRQPVVSALQQLLKEFPGWQIDLMIGLWDHLNDWPNMGISIRANEIVDDLQRQYFPKEFQDLVFEGSRRGNVCD
jgi:hypothetical protein